MTWWRRNNFSVDTEEASPADAEKMNKLYSLVQKWSDINKPEDEAGLDDSLDWFRRMNFEEINDSLQSYEGDKKPKVPETPLFTGKLSEEQKRAQEMASALDWLRNNDADIDINDEESLALSVQTFKKIDSLMPKSDDAGSGPTTLSSALDWLRSKTDVDDETVSSFKKLDNVLAKTAEGSGFGGALDWLRKRQAEKAAGAEDEEDFAKVTSLSTKPKSEEEKRADEMANALAWLRSNDAVEDIDDDMSLGIGSVGSFMKIDAKPRSSSSTPGIVSALDWLRSQEKKAQVEEEEDEDIETSPFTQIRPKSAEEKRANQMSSALDWLRDNGADFDEDDDDLPSFQPVAPLGTFKASDSDMKYMEIDNAPELVTQQESRRHFKHQ